MSSSLKLLVQLLEGEPGCGTKPPGWHPPHPHPPGLPPEVLERIEGASYATRAVLAAAHDAVRLHQLGENIGGAVKELLIEGAGVLFDEYCGSVPLSELARGLLHWPPPPPSPWVRLTESLATQYAVEALTDRDQKLEKPRGNIKTILELIREVVAHRITGGGGGSGGSGTNINIPLPVIGPVPHFPVKEVQQYLGEQAGGR